MKNRMAKFVIFLCALALAALFAGSAAAADGLYGPDLTGMGLPRLGTSCKTIFEIYELDSVKGEPRLSTISTNFFTVDRVLDGSYSSGLYLSWDKAGTVEIFPPRPEDVPKPVFSSAKEEAAWEKEREREREAWEALKKLPLEEHIKKWEENAPLVVSVGVYPETPGEPALLKLYFLKETPASDYRLFCCESKLYGVTALETAKHILENYGEKNGIDDFHIIRDKYKSDDVDFCFWKDPSRGYGIVLDTDYRKATTWPNKPEPYTKSSVFTILDEQTLYPLVPRIAQREPMGITRRGDSLKLPR